MVYIDVILLKYYNLIELLPSALYINFIYFSCVVINSASQNLARFSVKMFLFIPENLFRLKNLIMLNRRAKAPKIILTQ